jgi:hypothetical protein
MKTIGADNPLMPILMQGVIEGSALPNKQQLLEQLAASQQPNPQQQQQEQMALQIQLETAKATIAGLQAEAGKTQAETQQIVVDTQLAPQVAQAKLVTALSTNIKKGEGDDIEFERRAKIAELMIKERDLDLKERNMDQDLLIVSKQMQNPLDKTEKV